MVQSEKYFTHIIYLLNLTTDKKVGLTVKSQGRMMNPTPPTPEIDTSVYITNNMLIA